MRPVLVGVGRADIREDGLWEETLEIGQGPVDRHCPVSVARIEVGVALVDGNVKTALRMRLVTLEKLSMWTFGRRRTDGPFSVPVR